MTHHSTFTIERRLAGSAAHGFSFWAQPELKRRWSSCHPDWRELEYHMDFRVGGGEISRMVTPDGVEHDVISQYQDIEVGRRIVYAYRMIVDGQAASASLATVEFADTSSGSLMTYTEQVALLTGAQSASALQFGTETGFERLVLEIERDLVLSH